MTKANKKVSPMKVNKTKVRNVSSNDLKMLKGREAGCSPSPSLCFLSTVTTL